MEGQRIRRALAFALVACLSTTVTAAWFPQNLPRRRLLQDFASSPTQQEQPPAQVPVQPLQPAVGAQVKQQQQSEAPAGRPSPSPAEAPGLSGPESRLPFIFLHGLGGSCNEDFYTKVSEQIKNELPGIQGYCLEIGNGKRDSWLLSMMDQVNIVCDKVKADSSLSRGFNLVGFSQGALIGRGYIEFCGDGPKVKNFVSLGGPQAGVASFPACDRNLQDAVFDERCTVLNALTSGLVYKPDIQSLLAPAQYLKIPEAYDQYLNNSLFLPVINNERPEQRDPLLKERFSNLSQLILVEFEQDRVLVPLNTAQFGFFPPYNTTRSLPASQTQLYIEDWIGLRALDEQGKVIYVSAPGSHLNMTMELVSNVVVPALA